MKLLVHLKFKGPCLVSCQWATNFGCPSQYRVVYAHIQILKIMITSVDPKFWSIIHVPKWRQIDPQILVASTKEELA
jgi:hypothetical protein